LAILDASIIDGSTPSATIATKAAIAIETAGGKQRMICANTEGIFCV